MNTVILTKVKLQKINGVDIPARAPNKLRGDAIKLGAIYACDVKNIEILETIFQRKNYIIMN